MKVWILALYMAGATPGDMQVVDNIVSEAACRTLGEEMLGTQKQVNGGNRYIFRCYSVEKAHG